MKKLRVKVRKHASVVINYDIKKIITDKGKFERTPANRNLEYFIYKYRRLLKGGE